MTIYQTRLHYFTPPQPPFTVFICLLAKKEIARRVLRVHARSAISGWKGEGKNKALFVCGSRDFIPALPSVV